MRLIFTLALFVDLLAGFLDAHITDLGIRKGISVEGNSMITGLWRTSRPKLWQLITFNLIQASVLCVFAILSPWNSEPGVFLMLSASALGADAARHFQGAWKWRRLGA